MSIELTRFTKFDAELNVVRDEEATKHYGKPMYRVTEAFSFYVGAKEDQTWVYIPVGFLTDGATIPSWLHWLIKPWGKHGQAAVVHDMLCDVPYLHTPEGPKLISFNRVHKVFKEALKVSGNSDLKVFAMYWAVRTYFFFKGYKVNLRKSSHNQVTLRGFLKGLEQN